MDVALQGNTGWSGSKAYRNNIGTNHWGHGSGPSGRAVAVCPSKPGSNPGTNLAFSGSELVTGSILNKEQRKNNKFQKMVGKGTY